MTELFLACQQRLDTVDTDTIVVNATTITTFI